MVAATETLRSRAFFLPLRCMCRRQRLDQFVFVWSSFRSLTVAPPLASSRPELYSRDAIRSSKRISNPGCFATNTQLLIAPLLPYIESTPTVAAISGYSGAGTKKGSEPKITPEDLHHTVRPYSLTDHIHEREAGYHLRKLIDFRTTVQPDDFKVAFMPFVAPWFQGITSNVSVPLNKELRASEVVELFEQKYERERLVEVVKGIPEVHEISGKHGVKIGGFQVHSSGRRVVLVVSWLTSALKNRVARRMKLTASCRAFWTTCSRARRRSACRILTWHSVSM